MRTRRWKTCWPDYSRWHGQRFLIENRVEPTPGFTGTMDAYDLRDHAVIDWKFPGTTKMSTVRHDQHPGILYRGAGPSLRARRPARRTHSASCGSRSSTRRILHQHLRVGSAVDHEIAMAAINPLTSTIAMAADLQVDRHPRPVRGVPATPFQCDYAWHHLKPAGPYEVRRRRQGLRRRPLTPRPSVTEVSAADLLAPQNPAQRTV